MHLEKDFLLPAKVYDSTFPATGLKWTQVAIVVVQKRKYDFSTITQGRAGPR